MDRVLRIFLSKAIKSGALNIETASGQRFTVGDGSPPIADIKFCDRAAERDVILNPALRFGELFMDGRVKIPRGSIYDVISIASRNLRRFNQFPWLRTLEKVRRKFRSLEQRNHAAKARRNTAHHYDLDGRLYELFLDQDRQYSCAYFEREGASLDEAQLAKKRHIAAKLLIEPGDRVLDIGCGWGGMGLYLAEICDANVTGITLSSEQLGVAMKRAADKKLEGKAQFLLQDYREVDKRFDRIVSVGMFEHVGVGYYDTFFQQAAKLLEENGVMLLHTIGHEGEPSATNSWVAKYIFPGGYVPSLSDIMPAIERSGLLVTDIEILRLHYAETLRHWRERFLAHRAEAAAMYDERFCRMWEFYLAGCECTFRFEETVVFQIQIAKRLDSIPITRDSIAAREAELKRRDSVGPTLRIAG